MNNNSKIINNTNNRLITSMNNLVATSVLANSYGFDEFLPLTYDAPLFFAKPITPVVARKITGVRYMIFEYTFYLLDDIGDANTLTDLESLLTSLVDDYGTYMLLHDIFSQGTPTILPGKGYRIDGYKMRYVLSEISNVGGTPECCDLILVEGQDGATGPAGPQGPPGAPGSGAVNSVNTFVGDVVLDTDDIDEGSTNLYFTTARARQSISGTGDIDYDDTTGVISYTGTGGGAVDSVNGLTGTVVLDTDDVAEGTTNLYFTDQRVRDAISVTGELNYDDTTGIIDFSESDPIFAASDAAGIDSTDITNWNQAYNKYVNSIAFNTANGDLTLTRRDATTFSVNLDGRYLTTAVTSVGVSSTDLSVSGSPITTSGSITLNVNSGAITYAKIQNVTQARLLGRYTASTGSTQEISLGTGLSLDAGTGVLSATNTNVGTVTSVATDSTLSGGPITSTGTLAINLANPNSWSGGQRGTILTGTDAGTITLDFNSNNHRIQIAGSRTLGIPSNLVSGQSGVINVRQDATGSRALSYAWIFQFVGGLTAILSTPGYSFDAFAYFVNYYIQSTVTITSAATGVVTMTAHGLMSGSKVQFTTTGALPTNITTNVSYWVTVIDANNFYLSTTQALAAAGTYINTTSGTQSGTHTCTAGSITLTLLKNIQ